MKTPKLPISPLTPQYIVDTAGKKTAVILDINSFDRLMTDIEDMYFGRQAQAALEEEEEEIIPHKIIKRKTR